MNGIILLLTLATTLPTSPAKMPATQPINPLIPRPMSPQYSLLLSHSMFVRGHQAIDTHHEGVYHPPASMPSTMPVDSGLVSKPEDSLIFNGVTVSNDTPMAFIEDTTNQSVQTVHVGEPIAQGRVTEITLDSLSYTNAQHTMHLHIGQTLSGGEATPTPIATSNPSEAPITGDSVADRMRRKRQLELLGH